MINTQLANKYPLKCIFQKTERQAVRTCINMETRVICSEMYLTSKELQNLKSKRYPKTTLNVDVKVENKISEEQQTTTQTVTNSKINDPKAKETKSKLKPEVFDGPILNKVRKEIPKAIMKNMTNSEELRKTSASAVSKPLVENNRGSKSSTENSKLKPEVTDGPSLNKVLEGIPKVSLKNMKKSQEFRKSSARAGSESMEEKFSNSKSSMPLAQWKIIFLSICLMLYYIFFYKKYIN